jgi:glycerophosphoryl diester phosphodiesterase
VLIDNGFGAKINSADALLRIYRARITWATSGAEGTGRIAIDPEFIQLADPDRKLPFPITRGDARDRWLTGADLDPESFVRMPDGSFWIGDEFGPFLLHVDTTGKVLAPPVELPNRKFGGAAASKVLLRAPRSSGFMPRWSRRRSPRVNDVSTRSIPLLVRFPASRGVCDWRETR